MTGNPVKKYFDYFMEAFEKQQKEYSDKKIVYSDNGIVEIVWKPEWSNFDCGNKKKVI